MHTAQLVKMNIAVITIIGIIAGMMIFINPFFGLIITVALIPQSIIQALGGSVFGLFTAATPIKIIGGITFLSAFIKHVSEKQGWSFLKKPFWRFFLIFLVYILISGFANPGEFTRENFTVFISFAMLGFSILSLVNNLNRFKIILWTAIISVSIVSIKSLISNSGAQELARASGAAYGPNEFAISLLPFLGVSFSNIFTEKKGIMRILSVVGTLGIVFALIKTVSRGGIIGLLGMCLIVALKAKKKIIAILFMALLVALFINNMPQTLRERFENTKVEEEMIGEGTIDSTTRRFYLNKASWKIFMAHPLFGIGIGNYYYECRLYAPISAGRAHNMYLEIMAELGIVGIFLFLGILFLAFRILQKVIKSKTSVSGYARGLLIGLAGFLVAALFLHAQQEKSLWFVIFMAVALERIYERNYI